MRAYIGKIILSCFTVFLIAAMLYSEYHLEIKKKEFGFTSKQKEGLTLEECNDLIFRRQWKLTSNAGEVKKKLYANILLKGLHPVQIVEYERIPFVEQRGNVRVTLDKSISLLVYWNRN